MTGFPFRLGEMTGHFARMIRIGSSDRDAAPADSWAKAAQSAEGKRRRILEEARTAVLDRIRQTR